LIERKRLEAWLNDFLRIEKVSDYLPNGLQIEGREKVGKITTAVSINMEVIEAAVQKGAQALIVHHGMFWKNEEGVITGYRKERIKKILENEINLFAYHLPLDMHPRISNNRLILENLGVNEIVPSESLPEDFSIGLKGYFQTALSFKDLLDKVNSYFGIDSPYFKYGKDEISSIFVVSGGGRNLIDKVGKLGVDAYLTGDAGETTPYLVKECSLNYIYPGHYKTERPGIIELGNTIEKELGVEVEFLEVENLL